jgi:hypothetical protein
LLCGGIKLWEAQAYIYLNYVFAITGYPVQNVAEASAQPQLRAVGQAIEQP